MCVRVHPPPIHHHTHARIYTHKKTRTRVLAGVHFAVSIGSNNVFESKSSLSLDSKVNDGCKVGVSVRLDKGVELEDHSTLLFPGRVQRCTSVDDAVRKMDGLGCADLTFVSSQSAYSRTGTIGPSCQTPGPRSEATAQVPPHDEMIDCTLLQHQQHVVSISGLT